MAERTTSSLVIDHDGEDGLSNSRPVSDLAARLISVKTQSGMIALLRGEVRPSASKTLSSDVKAHVPVLAGHLEDDRPREAIATALAMIFLDADHAIACMRRDGVLRASRYSFRGSLIGRVAKAVLGAGDMLTASPDGMMYLRSVEALSRLAGNASVLQRELETTIRSRRDVVLKTVLVIVDGLFYRGWLNDHDASSLSSHRYSSEEYAEAASLIIRTFATLFPIDGGSFVYVDEEAAGRNALIYERLLISAIRLTKFREAELFIDGLPYRADGSGGAVTVSSVDPDLERSIRLGYIQAWNQGLIRFTHLQEADEAISIRSVIDRGFELGSFGDMLQLVEQPVRRLVFRLPAVPAIFERFFARDELFRDELQMLLTLDVDNFGEFEELIFAITDDVTSMDVFKVQRYFNFISCAYQRRLADVEDKAERWRLTLASTLLVIRHEDLVEQLRLVLGREDKARKMISLLAMDPSEPHLDLQYRPFVKAGDYYMIAPHVVAASNLVRNTIVANRLRSAAIGPADRMVIAVTEALRSAGFLVRSDFKARIAGRELEFDVVAWRDGSLFLFECKNAYHPVSVHEMRNSWDHIRSASKQLDKRRGILADAVNRAALFQKLEWRVDASCDVHTGIVIANRVFHGAVLNGHPIRQAHELINVLTSGRIVADEDSLSFWLGAEFQTADLIAYLGSASIAADQLAALDSREWRYSIGSRDLAFSSYVLDMMKWDRELREKHGPPIPGGRRQGAS